jgi:hypothetical protein
MIKGILCPYQSFFLRDRGASPSGEAVFAEAISKVTILVKEPSKCPYQSFFLREAVFAEAISSGNLCHYQ